MKHEDFHGHIKESDENGCSYMGFSPFKRNSAFGKTMTQITNLLTAVALGGTLMKMHHQHHAHHHHRGQWSSS